MIKRKSIPLTLLVSSLLINSSCSNLTQRDLQGLVDMLKYKRSSTNNNSLVNYKTNYLQSTNYTYSLKP